MIRNVEVMVWGIDDNARRFEIHCKNMNEGLRLLELLKDSCLFRTIHYTNNITVIQSYDSNGYRGIHYHENVFLKSNAHWYISGDFYA